MNHILRRVFFSLIIRPLIVVVLGLNLRRGTLLPDKGPAIIVANHNSHLDTLVLMTLLPAKRLRITRPVAAMDYFMKNPLMAWFATRIIGIVPIPRQRQGSGDPLKDVHAALAREEILILFPEGTRGEPEQMSQFKKGVAHLARKHPQTPVVPVYLNGLGKALPKGEALFVPFFCDVYIGEALYGQENLNDFMHSLETRFDALVQEHGDKQ